MTAERFSYCPRCGAEYREGFTDCADCRVPLVDTPPAAATGDDDELGGPIVELTRLPSRFEADVIIAKLRSAGIPVTMDAADAGGWYPHLGFVQGYRVLVTEEDLEEARQLLPHEAGPVRRRRRPGS